MDQFLGCRPIPQLPKASSAELISLVIDLPNQKLTRQARIHLLLASNCPLQIEQISKVIFERILGERILTNPVIGGIPAAN